MTLRKFGALVLSAAMLMSMLSGCSNQAEPKAETNQAEVSQPAEEASETSEAVELTEAQKAYNTYFVTPQWLNEKGEDSNLVIIDARGQEAYEKGHIPGSLPVAWQGLSQMGVEFASENWGTIKDETALGEALSALGLTLDSEVVIYADTQQGWGEDGRIMWTLQAAGIVNVKMLDGGVEGWKKAGFDLTKTASEAVASDFKVESLDLSASIDTATLAANYDQYKVIDTRDKDEYEGAQKFGEARGGHLPGALWISYKDLLQADGTLKPVEKLEVLFEEAGLEKSDQIVTYCTAGIRSAHFAEILTMLGYDNVMNYDESFYVWANTPEMKLGRVVKDYAYNYYAPDHLKSVLESKGEFTLLDIQPEDDFEAHHITGAIETNAYPVKTDDDKAKLDITLEALKADENDIVIVCPRGGGGAERTYQHLEAQGIDTSRLFILEGGQADWPYEELLN